MHDDERADRAREDELPELTDLTRLFERFRRTGDARALGAVVDRIAPELLSIALHLAGDPAEAEDLVQETLITAMEKAERWDAGRPLRPWLIGILTNRARLARTRRARALEPDRVTPPSAPVDPEGRAIELELDDDVEAALLRVPDAYQPVLVLRLRHHLSVAEIANALRRPPGTVRSQLQRGQEALRRLLPASYAGALLALLVRPTRGLAAIREAVLSHATTAAAASAAAVSVTSVTGVLIVKQLAVLLLVVAGIATGTALLAKHRPSAGAVAPPAGSAPTFAPPPELVAEPAPARTALPVDPERALAREAAVRMLPAVQVGRGALRVRLVFEDDATPAAGRLAMVQAFGERAPFYDPIAVTTDANGEALLADLPAGPAYVRVLRGAEGPVEIVAGDIALCELRAWTGVTVEVRVVDDAGEPVPGATLWVSERFRSNLGYAVARADAHGRATLGGLLRTQYVSARAAGRAASPLYPVRGEAGGTVKLELTLAHLGGAVAGTVRDALGAPIEGALVMLGPEQPTVAGRLADGTEIRGPVLARAHTGANGAFELDSLERGSVPVLVRAAGFGPFRGEIAVGDGVAPLDVVLASETRITGSVVDALGQPVVAAQVNTLPFSALGVALTYTRGDGTFELDGLGAGPVALEASSDEGRARVELVLESGAEERWEAVLAPVPRIAGIVRDARGAPAVGVSVIASGAPGTDARVRSDSTDAAGRFVLDDLEPHEYRVVVQEPAGWQRFPLLVVEHVAPDEAPLELVLPDPALDAGTLVAEVAHADGTPVTSGALCLWHEELAMWREYPIGSGGSGGSGGASDAGRVRIAPIPPGTVNVEIRVPDAPWLRLGAHAIEAGRTVDLGRLVLSAAGTLAGSIDAPEGELAFLLIDADGHEGGVITRRGAEYESGPLAPGTYTLAVTGAGIAPLRFEVAIAAGETTRRDARLVRAPSRTVHLVLPDGATARRAWCDLRDEHGTQLWVDGNIAREDDRFVARISAPAGTYRLAAGTASGLRAAVELVMPPEGDETPLEVQLGG